MPLVRIDVLRGRPQYELTAIGSCVHQAMVADLGVPERDHFQILTEHDPGRLLFDRNYLDIDRSDGWSFGRGEANYLTLPPESWR